MKRHICDVKNSRLRYDLPISINDRVISPFCEDFIFAKIRKTKTLAKISEFTVVSNQIEDFIRLHVLIEELVTAPTRNKN